MSEAPANSFCRPAKYLNRLAGRLEDRHQIPAGAIGAAAYKTGSGGPMSATTKNPPKHLVREYLARRSRDPQPPPTPEEIRRQLGWGMSLQSDVKMAGNRS